MAKRIRFAEDLPTRTDSPTATAEDRGEAPDVLMDLAAARRRAAELERVVRREAGIQRKRPVGQIAQRGPKQWRLRVYLGFDPATGKRKYFSRTVRGTRKEAEVELRDLLAKGDAGNLGITGRDTVSAYLDRWLETVVEPSTRARTYDDYKRVVTDYLEPHLGAARLGQLESADVRSMVLTLRKRGLSPRTVRMAHEVLRNALGRAVTDGTIKSNPARSVVVKAALPPKRRKKMVTVLPDQVKDYIETARDERLGAFFVLQLFAGLRPGEGLALRWSDVQDSAVRVERTLVDILVGREGVESPFEEPKREGSRRAVVVPNVVLEFLRAHLKRQEEERLRAGDAWRDGDLVFCDEAGRPLKLRHVRWHFKQFAKAAGLPSGLTLYSLRHSTASLLLARGVNPKIVQERLGHADVGLTLNTYSHVMPGLQQQAADVLAELAE